MSRSTVASEEVGIWATQAADALTALQQLVGDAIAAGADVIDPDARALHLR